MIGSLLGVVASRRRNLDGNYFTTTWDASSGSIALPVVSGILYDFDYRINGGSWTNYNATPTVNHELVISSLSGNVTLEINPATNGLTQWDFNNGGDKTKILDVTKWGSLSVNTLSFYGCSNLDVSATDYPDISQATNLIQTFRGCGNLTSLDMSSWDVSSIISFFACFRGCVGLTSLNVSGWNTVSANNFEQFCLNCTNLTTLDVSSWNVSNVTNLRSFIKGCSLLTNLDISSWNVSSVTDAFQFLNLTSTTTSIYDAFLINADSLTVQSGVVWDFGASQYTLGGAAETARTNLINNDSWSITDGGGI